MIKITCHRWIVRDPEGQFFGKPRGAAWGTGGKTAYARVPMRLAKMYGRKADAERAAAAWEGCTVLHVDCEAWVHA